MQIISQSDLKRITNYKHKEALIMILTQYHNDITLHSLLLHLRANYFHALFFPYFSF